MPDRSLKLSEALLELREVLVIHQLKYQQLPPVIDKRQEIDLSTSVAAQGSVDGLLGLRNDNVAEKNDLLLLALDLREGVLYTKVDTVSLIAKGSDVLQSSAQCLALGGI